MPFTSLYSHCTLSCSVYKIMKNCGEQNADVQMRESENSDTAIPVML